MKPLCVARRKLTSLVALVASALCLAPSLSYAQDFEAHPSAVRFVGEPASFGPQASGAIDPIKLGDFSRGPVNFTLTLAPHGSVSPIAGGEQATGGAELRLGAARSDRPEDGSWFFFAGAKGQAVSWDMGGSAFDLDDFVQLKQRQTIGDFQAGFGYQMGGAQVSLGVMRRTYKINTYSLREWKDRQNMAGISIAWRR